MDSVLSSREAQRRGRGHLRSLVRTGKASCRLCFSLCSWFKFMSLILTHLLDSPTWMSPDTTISAHPTLNLQFPQQLGSPSQMSLSPHLPPHVGSWRRGISEQWSGSPGYKQVSAGWVWECGRLGAQAACAGDGWEDFGRVSDPSTLTLFARTYAKNKALWHSDQLGKLWTFLPPSKHLSGTQGRENWGGGEAKIGLLLCSP